jgi:hypothetical protein
MYIQFQTLQFVYKKNEKFCWDFIYTAKFSIHF